MRGMTTYASDGTVFTEPTAPASSPVEQAEQVEQHTVVVDPEVDSADTESLPAVRDDAPLDAEVVDDEQLAADGKWEHQSEWEYDWLDYKGDKLAIRVPHQNALTALFQATQQCSPEFQMELAAKFVKRHISQESIERVLERMSDPDDEDYSAVDIGVWGDLLGIISRIGGERAAKDAKALAAVQNGKAKA